MYFHIHFSKFHLILLHRSTLVVHNVLFVNQWGFFQTGSCTSKDSHMWRQNQADAITWGFFIRCPVFCLYWCLVILGYHGHPGGLRIFQWNVFSRVKNGPHDRKFFKFPNTPYDKNVCSRISLAYLKIQFDDRQPMKSRDIILDFQVCHWIPGFKIQNHRVHDHS